MFKILTTVLWIATHPFLHFPFMSRLLVLLLFQRRQTLLIKPDKEELSQLHFLFVGFFFLGRKEKYFANVISDICIRKHGLSLPWRVFKILQGKDYCNFNII